MIKVYSSSHNIGCQLDHYLCEHLPVKKASSMKRSSSFLNYDHLFNLSEEKKEEKVKEEKITQTNCTHSTKIH